MAVSALGYLGFGVSDPEKWTRFATEVIGWELMVVGEDCTVYLRMDELHHRIALHPTGSDDLAYVGLQTHSRQDFGQTKKDLFEAGIEFVQAS